MVQVWKIAPGTGAEDWDLFRDHGCIGLGWLELPDFQRFGSETQVLAALGEVYPAGKPGCGSGAAEMIWRFVAEVSPGDIVVANAGYNRVVGVGRVTGDYLPPASDRNPLRGDTKTHRHHARRVDWLVTEPTNLSGDRFFVQSALWPLGAEKFETIRRAYAGSAPQLAPVFSQFLGGYEAGVGGPLPDEVDGSQPLTEGAKYQVTLNAYERNPVARRQCLSFYGTDCRACEFRFGAAYGPEAEGYIHVHHVKPLSEVGGEYVVDPIKDLVPVCPNCHAMIHMGGKCRTLDEIRRLLSDRKPD